jgi:hypothetical protein
MALHLPHKRTQLHSLALSLDDVTRIFERLLGHVREQADIEIAKFIKPEGKSDEEFQAEKEDVRTRAFQVTVTIAGDNGASLYGDDVAVFSSPNKPNEITSIYMTNGTAYQLVAGQRPLNAFDLLLDFSKPPLLDSNNPLSSPTPNRSNLSVDGDRDAWVAAVTDAVMAVARHRKTRRLWIHRAFVYDFGLLVLGLPFGLYLCWKLSPFVTEQLATIHPFLSATAYIYVVLLVSWGYRILFGYTKWVFPTVELIDNRDTSTGHRVFWWAIVISLIGNFAWEGMKAAWGSA